MTLWQFLTDEYLPAKPQVRAEDSKAQYQCAIRMLEQYLHRTATIDDLNRSTLTKFLNWYFETPKSNGSRRAASSTNKHRAMLRALWNHAYDADIIDRPVKRVPKFPEPPPNATAWTLDELARILRQVRTLDYTLGDVKAKHFWRALVLTLFDSAGRISAVLKSPLEDFNPKTRELRLRAEHQKTGREQIEKLHPDTCAVLAKLPKGRQRLFPWPYDANGRWSTLRAHFRKRVLIPAGLPHGPDRMFHAIRKTVATGVKKKLGLEAAAKKLGHSSTTVTDLHYADKRFDPVVHTVDVLARPNDSKPNKKRKKKRSKKAKRRRDDG